MKPTVNLAERALRALSECNRAMLRAQTEAELLQTICTMVVEQVGYRMAWVGYPCNDEFKSFTVAAAAGRMADYPNQIKTSWDEYRPEGQGPCGVTLRTGKPTAINNFSAEPRYQPWRETASRCGFAASIGLPLHEGDRCFGVLSIYAAEPNAFDTEEIELLVELADDLSYGICHLRLQIARQEAEARRRQDESRYQLMIETSPEGFFVTDLEGRLSQVNEAYVRLSGYSRAELLTLRISYLDADDDAAAVRRQIAKIMDQGYAVFERRHRRKDGGIRHVEMCVNYWPQEGGLFFSYARDITARKRQELLQKARLQLFELGPRGDLDHLIQTALDIAEKLTESKIGFFHFVAPDQEPLTLQTWWSANTLQKRCLAEGKERHDPVGAADMWADCLRQGKPVIHNDYASLPHPGGWPPGPAPVVREIVVPILRNNRAVAILGVGNKEIAYHDDDIHFLQGLAEIAMDAVERLRHETELRAERNLLHALMDNLPDAIFFKDTESRFIRINRTVAQVLGVERVEAVLGKTDADFMPPPMAQERLLEEKELMATGESIVARVEKWEFKGQPCWLSTTKVPIRDPHGTVVGMIGVARDITAYKLAEQEQQKLDQRLLQAQKMEAIGTLAGGIAHDFNNILGVIFANLYLLQDEIRGTPAAAETAQEISKAAERARELVKQILTFSRQREQPRQNLPLGPLLREVAKFLRASLPANIAIELILDAKSPPVLADPTQIHQVIMNLATNALHAMEAHGGQLVIKLDHLVPAEESLKQFPELQRLEYTRLAVADTGHGMDAKTLERIFEPFFTTKPAGKGTGLGLAVVHGIVHAHQGVITVDTQVGRGTTFAVYLPSQNPASEPNSPTVFLAMKGHGERILVLDDEAPITGALFNILKRLDYVPTACNRAQEAITLVQANPGQFDLVLTDFTMPGMNGFEVARQLHALQPDLPVILCSGFAAEITPERLAAAGISKLLDKPVSPSVLTSTIQQVLAGPRPQ